MSDFHADTEKGLPALQSLVDRLGDDARHGDRYVMTHTALDGGEGWLNDLRGSHDHVVNTLSQWLRQLADPTASSTARAVAQATLNYRQTDAASAAKFDATTAQLTYQRPDPGTEYFVQHAGTESFADVAEPQSRLVPPRDYNADYPHQPSWADALSPASMGRNTIWAATDILTRLGMMSRPYDPYEFVLKPVIGDWAGFRACSDVMTNVAAATNDMVANLYWAENCLTGAWRGNAADSFAVLVQRVALAIRSAPAPLAEMAQRYQEAAMACHEFRNAAGTLISIAIDQAIVVVAAAAAGGATAPTVVGPIVGGAVAGYEGYQLYRTIRALMDAYTITNGIMSAVKSAMGSFGQVSASGFELANFPAVSGADSPLSALPGGG